MPPSKDKFPDTKGKIFGYVGLILLFFALSLGTMYFLHRHFSQGKLHIPSQLFSLPVITTVVFLLLGYYLADALRLYSVIKAMGNTLSFLYIIKLVFINIFISNVTPLATGGGFIQVYFMAKKGISLGEATAATSIRTILSAMILFTLTPLIIWLEPNEFKAFMHRHVLVAISAVSCAVVLFLLLITFWPNMIKKGVKAILYLLKRMRLLSVAHMETMYEKIEKEIDSFSQGFAHFFKKGGIWAASSVLWTVIFLLFLFSFSIVLISALGYKIPMLTVLAVQVVVTFFMYFAPTPGATGIEEGGYGLLFSQLVRSQDIMALTISWRFLTIYIGVIVGIFIFAYEFFRKRKVLGK
ncbi:hypothetical protein SpiGrapes_0752 [Sphaerochaeta pleomorpha str. Grapes]|uniref:Integral membrane protein n=1 Tax=Sphaerochaeta pleomorpha (strain ATCC BAA-1885 / DSM 22778 / Grapes) TaxID=158190 RepID=G8QYM4_SPHPG|nr:lysylphosphatidylglycerol synthase transmembrane domain-containing protein [Sphaerochaeta pleomorpha]AEV28587.1 hypothetical protein SpiGrapes_0752 [Sphaerochaeta pleomorpha str. Grapes]